MVEDDDEAVEETVGRSRSLRSCSSFSSAVESAISVYLGCPELLS
jgi:hypothetical protein